MLWWLRQSSRNPATSVVGGSPIGNLVESIDESEILVKKKLRGVVCKIKEEFGTIYAYVKTDKGLLRRFKPDALKIIKEDDKLIKIVVNSDTYRDIRLESVLDKNNIMYQYILASDLNELEKDNMVAFARKTGDTSFPYFFQNGKIKTLDEILN